MKKALTIIAFIFCSFVYGQSEFTVAHINAQFNISNDWSDFQQLTGAKLLNGYIDKKPAIKDAYAIKYVPTLILFKNGVEVKRWEAGLDMKLHLDPAEVQKLIDSL